MVEGKLMKRLLFVIALSFATYGMAGIVGSWRSTDGRYSLKQNYKGDGGITWETNFAPDQIGGYVYFKRAKPLVKGLSDLTYSDGVWEVPLLGGGTCTYDIELIIHWPTMPDNAPADHFRAEFTYPKYISTRGCERSGGYQITNIEFVLQK
jgi:hypothetical protein